MEILNNINQLLGDNLKQTISPGSKLKIAASSFSIYALEALKQGLERIDSLQFVLPSDLPPGWASVLELVSAGLTLIATASRDMPCFPVKF